MILFNHKTLNAKVIINIEAITKKFDYLLMKNTFYKPKQTYVPSGLATGIVDPAGTIED